MVFAQNAAMLNYAEDELAQFVGGRSNHIKIPHAPVPPIHYNNQSISISGGQVGAINFGNVHEIQVSLEALTQNGEIGIADRLADVTNAIMDAADASEAAKNELLEQVAFLSSQASAKPAERKPGAVKAVLTAIRDGAATIGSVATAWQAAEPLLTSYFGLGQ